jgi:hypothetical protein
LLQRAEEEDENEHNEIVKDAWEAPLDVENPQPILFL